MDVLLIMIVMYQILCFSDAMPDPATQKFMGISIMVTIGTHIIFDLSLLMYQSFTTVKTKVKMRRMKKQLKQNLKNNFRLNEILASRKPQQEVPIPEILELVSIEDSIHSGQTDDKKFQLVEDLRQPPKWLKEIKQHQRQNGITEN